MSYRGTSIDHDVLEERRLNELRLSKFPKIFDKQVDMKKVDKNVIETWIEAELEKLVPGDDILSDFVKNLMRANEIPDIKDIHLQLTSFLEDETTAFTKRLWKLLLEAQEDPNGVPAELVKIREEELKKRKLQEEEEERKQRERMEQRNKYRAGSDSRQGRYQRNGGGNRNRPNSERSRNNDRTRYNSKGNGRDDRDRTRYHSKGNGRDDRDRDPRDTRNDKHRYRDRD